MLTLKTGLIKTMLGLTLLIALPMTGIAIFIWQDYQKFIEKKRVLSSPILIAIPPGANFQQITDILMANGLLNKPHYFKWLAKQNGQASRIRSGEFSIESGFTIGEILEILIAGKTVQYSLTLVEGWQFNQVLELIQATPQLKKTLNYESRDDMMLQLGLPESHPEGLFFPDTYYFPRGMTDRDFLQRAYNRLDQILQEEWLQRAADLPYQGPYQALIMASIVEKETGRANERQAIAGVFVRRLQKSMRLQTDPTVIYAMGPQFDGNIRKKDLGIDSPYNTYKVKGLPPTPIALVGREAIHAALHPASGSALYFVSKGDGSHYFSDTLQEHNQAVATYQLKKKR